jgi:membrane associated rhomboid family serine protease
VGVSDRNYMRGRGPAPIAVGASYTVRVLVFLVLVHVAYRGAAGWSGRRLEVERWVHEWLLLSTETLRAGRVWTLLTAACLHKDAMHLALNALGLWYFGKLVEETLGSAKYLAFVLAAAVLSHVPYVVACFATHDPTPTIGASGVVLATLVFAAFHYPSYQMIFFVFPLKLWQLALLYVGLDVFGVIEGGGGLVDHWTHLGGAAFGFAVHRFDLFTRFRLPRLRRAPAVRERAPGPFREGNVRAEVDRILDKINAGGIGTLTAEEREFLKRNSKGYR